MRTEITIHNSVSLDGSLTGFMPEMGPHYSIAGRFPHDARLIGSETIRTGIEMFGETVPVEVPEDFLKPDRDASVPWWIVVDSGGKLKGMLHTCRRFEFCRDVIVLVSEKTPKEYITHLEERKYKYLIAGVEKVNLTEAFQQLQKTMGITKILADTGRVLGNLLLNTGLVSDLSLLVHPLIIGSNGYRMFDDISKDINLSLIKTELLEKGIVWLHYEIEKR
jgi:2,5-diamino-6-(ribosylamino)-4(3H)-pyrimidinone 5'-phosphate reductase